MNHRQPAESSLEHELLYTSDKYYNIHMGLIKPMPTFHDREKGNESAVVNVSMFYMEVTQKLRIYWQKFWSWKLVNQPIEQPIQLFI